MKSKKEVKSAIEGIKRIYNERIKLVEELYRYGDFVSPIMRDSELESKPSVLFLGQYSTGKTSFIKYLLGGDYPGLHIGPEPTTDRFVAVMHNKEELVIPGNALAVRADMPFTALNRFGNDFLTKFQASLLPSPLLENVTIIDTPGVLSGEKQRLGRSYNFQEIVRWFAARADMIILCFDAHKLDISDEFAETISVLHGNEEKVRIVLNKADTVQPQELMRVYGALMWSLGKVLTTPEVSRVYISSFWEKPFQIRQLESLFTQEREDLITDLMELPRFATIRKLNELVKRARQVKVHAYIISTIHDEMPSVFGKERKKSEIISEINSLFNRVKNKYNLPQGDFPNIIDYKERLKAADFSKFPKLNEKLLNALDRTLANDLPTLIKMFPMENVSSHVTNPFEFQNKFEEKADSLQLTSEQKREYEAIFDNLTQDENGRVSGAQCREIFTKSGLSKEKLKDIWSEVDQAKHGALSRDEFVLGLGMVEFELRKTLKTPNDDTNPF